ncbi:family 43 glycosylhydrolase, partial [Phycicoccus flavus]
AGGKWFLYYTAPKKGTAGCAGGNGNGHRCIGRAVADRPAGPYTGGREVACPAGGRWAIDPEVLTTPGHGLVMVYRDDAVTTGAETGISVVQLDANGFGKWSTRQTLLTSRDITWDTAGDASGTHIVENPSLIRVGGRWKLLWSGNKWDTRRYATGLADCGESVMSGRCTPTHVGRPWLGFVGAGDIDPVHGLPANHKGPGGMSAFRDNAGRARVVWHWYDVDTGARRAKTGTLSGSMLVS